MGKKNRKAKKRMEKRAARRKSAWRKKSGPAWSAHAPKPAAPAPEDKPGATRENEGARRADAFCARLLLLALLALIAGLCVLMGYAVKSLPVTDIVVEGESPYSDELLLETCGLSEGQALLLLRPNAHGKNPAGPHALAGGGGNPPAPARPPCSSR